MCLQREFTCTFTSTKCTSTRETSSSETGRNQSHSQRQEHDCPQTQTQPQPPNSDTLAWFPSFPHSLVTKPLKAQLMRPPMASMGAMLSTLPFIISVIIEGSVGEERDFSKNLFMSIVVRTRLYMMFCSSAMKMNEFRRDSFKNM